MLYFLSDCYLISLSLIDSLWKTLKFWMSFTKSTINSTQSFSLASMINKRETTIYCFSWIGSCCSRIMKRCINSHMETDTMEEWLEELMELVEMVKLFNQRKEYIQICFYLETVSRVCAQDRKNIYENLTLGFAD